MRRPPFDARLAIPASPHQLRQRLGVMGIGFFPLQGCGSTGMSRIEAHDGQAELLQRVVQPGCQLARLQADTLELRGMAPESRGQGIRLTRPLAPPHRLARPVYDVNDGFLVRHVEPSIVRHGGLPGLRQPTHPAVPRPNKAPLTAGSRSAHVERTIGWISRNWRLARDFERHCRIAAAFVRMAMIRIMLRRLAAKPSA
jgi:hypothetical protein